MDKILKKLKIEKNILTKTQPKQKIFNKVKNNVPPIKNYNFEADLLYTPKTKQGYKYLLVVVDIANNAFDIQEMKTKSSGDTLEAFKKMFKRNFIKQPKISIRTDNGSEFQGSFNKFLKDNKIIHRKTLPYRHKQMANVENLNKELFKIFTAYMNSIEMETGKPYNEWIDIIDIVRKELNIYRQVRLPSFKQWIKHLEFKHIEKEPKFKIGDFVHYKLDYPLNALNNKQNTPQFRTGDLRYNPVAKKIVKIIYMQDEPYYRYILDGVNNVSYSDYELIPSKEKTQKYEIKELISSKIIKNQKHYLVWWKGYRKNKSTYVSRKELIQDLGKTHLNELVKNMKK